MYENITLLHFLTLLCILLYSFIPSLYNLLLLYIVVNSEHKIHYSRIIYYSVVYVSIYSWPEL